MTTDRSIERIVHDITSERGADIIIIGGDGSMNEAVNAIKDFKRTRIAFISKGSANDLSKALCAGKTKEEIIKDIADGKIKRSVEIGVMESGDTKKLFNISSGIKQKLYTFKTFAVTHCIHKGCPAV